MVFLPLSGGLGLALKPLDKRVEVVIPSVDVFPFKLLRVSCRSRVAASAANEEFAIIFRRSGDLARRVYGMK